MFARSCIRFRNQAVVLGRRHKRTNHVVFKAEDAVVNVELRQLFFMDADLVLLLDLHDPGLNLLPCCIGKF